MVQSNMRGAYTKTPARSTSVAFALRHKLTGLMAEWIQHGENTVIKAVLVSRSLQIDW